MVEYQMLYCPAARDNLTLPVVLEGTHKYLATRTSGVSLGLLINENIFCNILYI